MKKEVKIAIAVALALWFFIMGFEIGSFKEKKAAAEYYATTQPPVTQSPSVQNPITEQPSAQPPATENNNPSVGPTQNNQPAPSAPQGEDISNLSNEQIVEKVKTAVTALKAEQNYTAQRSRTIRVVVVDCSLPSMVDKINEIVNGVVSKVPTEETYVFQGGVATDSTGAQINSHDSVPPINSDFTLTAAGLKSASAVKNGDNITYTLNLIDESTTAESPTPLHHSGSTGFLDLADLGLPSIVKITKANMYYSGSYYQITVNKAGKIIEMSNKIPMTGDGEASVFGLSGHASFEGDLVEIWKVTY